jgi:hypothetical protein
LVKLLHDESSNTTLGGIVKLDKHYPSIGRKVRRTLPLRNSQKKREKERKNIKKRERNRKRKKLSL